MEREGRRKKGRDVDPEGERSPSGDGEEAELLESLGVSYPDGGGLLSRGGGASEGRGLYLRVGVADDVKAYSRGFIEDILGRPQGLLHVYCVIAVVLGFAVVLVLLWARAADLCSPAPKQANQWTQGRSRWCCQLFGVACPEPGLSASEATGAFNCTAAAPGWSALQQAYCCESEGVCGTSVDFTTARPPLYDCSAGWSDWAAKWPVSKQAWCCQNAGRGCVAPNLADQHIYCDGGEDSERTWSEVKKEWCCWYRGLGCPLLEVDTPPALPQPGGGPWGDPAGDRSAQEIAS